MRFTIKIVGKATANAANVAMPSKNLVQRFLGLDIVRGRILLWMAFANAYYALSGTQNYWFGHDGETMSPADLIMPFFFFLIGFNLVLVRHFKNKTNIEILGYALKRGAMLALVGAGLISYTMILFHYGLDVIFRSVLVVLGLAMISTALVAVILPKELYRAALASAGTLLLFFFWPDAGPTTNENFRFVSPWFALTSLWGMVLAERMVKSRDTFFRDTLLFSAGSLFAGVLLTFYETPSRLTLNAGYIFISWSLISIVIAAALKYYRHPRKSSRLMRETARLGSHPFSFWIIQSVVIGLVAVGSTLLFYLSENMVSYFREAPVRHRVIEDHLTALAVSVLAALLSFLCHRLYRKIVEKRAPQKKIEYQ